MNQPLGSYWHLLGGAGNSIYIYMLKHVKTYSSNHGIVESDNPHLKKNLNVAFSGVHPLFSRKLDNVRYTRCSMYGIFTYIYPQKLPKCR